MHAKPIHRRVPPALTKYRDPGFPPLVDFDVDLCALAVVFGLYPELGGPTEAFDGVCAAAGF